MQRSFDGEKQTALREVAAPPRKASGGSQRHKRGRPLAHNTLSPVFATPRPCAFALKIQSKSLNSGKIRLNCPTWEVPINTLNRILTYLKNLLAAAFDPNAEKQHRWLGWLWLAGLWAIGAFLWGKFLNWGKIPFDWLDWAEINAPRTAFLKDAVMKGVLPLHMADASALRGVTDRFMSIPDALLSPQILLLRFMEVGTFFLVNTLLLYTIGMFGLLWFRRRFSLSLVSFSALFLLFNFNGHILAHFSVGHTTWAGYLLFPWFAVLVFRLLQGESGWRWVTQTALMLFLIYLQGAFHQFIWGLDVPGAARVDLLGAFLAGSQGPGQCLPAQHGAHAAAHSAAGPVRR